VNKIAAPAWRRIGAFGIDYLVGIFYAAALFAVVLAFNGGRGPQWQPSALAGQLMGIAAMTCPVILYFSFCESSPWQATVGKRALRIQVVTLAGHRCSLSRTLTRATVKFLPWELGGHTFVWQLLRAPRPDGAAMPSVPIWAWALMILAVLVDIWYLLALFIGDRRTPYDRIARTCVVRAQAGGGNKTSR
jgi:uncharacterized RDD family membrane protein YckC